MINPYFTFTTDNKNLCCYKTSAILNINFYIGPNEKYKMEIQTTADIDANMGIYTFQDKKYWDVAQERWMDIIYAARNEAANNTNMKYDVDL